MMADNEATYRALALVEMLGKPFTTKTLDELSMIVGIDGGRLAVTLAELLRCHLAAEGTPVDAWCAEYRKQKMRDEASQPPGMA